jgi:hypothetical protein
MALSLLDTDIKQVLLQLKKESATLAIAQQLKKHLPSIKDLVRAGVSIPIIAEKLLAAGVSGTLKDIIAVITASIESESGDDEQNQDGDQRIATSIDSPSPTKTKKSRQSPTSDEHSEELASIRVADAEQQLLPPAPASTSTPTMPNLREKTPEQLQKEEQLRQKLAANNPGQVPELERV